MSLVRLFAPLCLVVLVLSAAVTGQRPQAFVVAHRGASAYAPEHTLPSYRLAIEQGAEYVEQDLVITKDGVLVCLHDPSLERTTNVEEVFPDRFTEVTVDGTRVRRWYAEDFTLAEIKRLDAGGGFASKFAGERIPTFDEAVALVKGKAGVFPELKTPGRLRAKGIDLERAVADALTRHGLVGATHDGRSAVQLQVFEEDSVRRLATLLPTVPRSLLIGTPDAAARWLSAEGLDEVRTFATGVAPRRQLIDADPALVERAHARGLTVVPWTFRVDQNTTPDQLTRDMRRFVTEHRVDGLFTDNPDLFPR